MRFGIKSLLAITLAVAVYFAIAQTAGYVVTAGISACVAVLFAAIFAWRRKSWGWRQWPVRGFVVVVCLAGLWMLSVDCVWIVERCPDCEMDHNIAQWRMFGIPLHTRTADDHSRVSSTLLALGRPCQHEKSVRWQRYRWWGLVYNWPRGGGITGIDTSLTSEEMEKLSQLSAADPNLRDEFYRNVVVDRDVQYIREFFETHLPYEEEQFDGVER